MGIAMRLLSRSLLGLVFFTQALTAGSPEHLSAVKGDSFLKYLLIHPLHHVEGISKDVVCTMDYDDATHTVQAASFEAEVSSFDSGNSSRDSHAMEVLDALTFPMVSFKSSTIAGSGQNLQVQGNLTFHGQTKPIAFPATMTSEGGKVSVAGSAAVSLTAYGIDRPSLLMIPVEDTLHISFTMVFAAPGH